MRGKEQEPVDRGAGRRHRRGRQARRHHDRRRARRPRAPTSRSSRSTPPAPVLAVAIHAKSKGDEDKLANALHRLHDEDPALRLERNAETHQTLLWGMGETHLGDRARAAARASSASRSRPRTCRSPYRETITGTGRGRGQVQEADRRPRPVRRRVRCGSSRSSAAAASSSSTRSSAARSPASSSPRSRRASHETMEHGGVFGFPVVDVRVTLLRRQVPLRSTARRWLQDGRRRSGSRRRWPRPSRSCSSR